MAVNPFVRALSLTGFDKFCTEQGLKPAEMLRRASLPVESLQRQDGILSFRHYCALLELCAQQSGNRLFGLQFGLHQGISVFGDLLFLIRNTGTVGEALLELRANYSLYNGAAEVGVDIENGIAVLSYQVSDRNMPGLHQAEELACGVAIKLMRTLVTGDWYPRAVMLRHFPLCSEPSYLHTLGILPTFAAPHTGLALDAEVLMLPLSSADESLRQMLAAHIGRLERLSAAEMPGYVRQLLRNLLPSGRATIERVADCVDLTPRTLQRRLAREGTSFQQLLDETRQDMARRLLEAPSVSMAQMAGLLGYSDPSGFNRAFNRWFEASPLKWQKQHCPNRQPRQLRSRRPD